MVWLVKTYPAQSTGLESKKISSGAESVFLDFPFYRTDISSQSQESSGLPVNRLVHYFHYADLSLLISPPDTPLASAS